MYFDTCVYHQPGIDLLTRVIPVANVLFASEMIGAVRGIDPETGHNFDDTKRYIDALKLSAEEKAMIYEGNARRVVSAPGRHPQEAGPLTEVISMFELGVVYRNIRRADAALADRLGAFGSATVHEAMGRVGLMQTYMRPIYPGHRRRVPP